MKKERIKNLIKAIKLNYADYSFPGDKKPAEKDGKLLMPYNIRLDVWKYYDE